MLSRSFKVGVLAIGKGVSAVSGLVAMAILSRLLTKSEFGTYGEALQIYLILFPILALGMSQAIVYFLARDPAHSRTILVENLVPLFVTGILFLGLLLVGGNQLLAYAFDNDKLVVALLLFSPYALALIPLTSLEFTLVTQNRVWWVTAFSIVSRLLVLAAIAFAAFQWRNANAVIVATVAAHLAVLPFGIWLMFRACPDGSARPRREGIKAQLAYALPLGFAGMVGGIAQQVDKTAVMAMASEEVFAVFRNGATEIPLIGILSASVAGVLLPEVNRLVDQGQPRDGLEIWKRAAAKTSLFIFPIMCLLFVVSAEFIRFVYSSKYSGSVPIFRVYLAIMPLRIVVWAVLLLAAKRTDVLLWGAIGGLVLNVLLSVPMILWLGPIGAAVGTVVVMYVWLVPYYLRGTSEVTGAPWSELLPWRRLGAVFLVSAGTALPLYLLKPLLPDHAFLTCVVCGMVYVPIAFGAFCLIGWIHPAQVWRELSEFLARKTGGPS